MSELDIENKADEIAQRGVKRVQVEDRAHTFFSPNELLKAANQKRAEELDSTYGGKIKSRLTRD
jgi:hypothetical protein